MDASGVICSTKCWGRRGKHIGHEELGRSRKVFWRGWGGQEGFCRRVGLNEKGSVNERESGKEHSMWEKNIPCGKR